MVLCIGFYLIIHKKASFSQWIFLSKSHTSNMTCQEIEFKKSRNWYFPAVSEPECFPVRFPIVWKCLYLIDYCLTKIKFTGAPAQDLSDCYFLTVWSYQQSSEWNLNWLYPWKFYGYVSRIPKWILYGCIFKCNAEYFYFITRWY